MALRPVLAALVIAACAVSHAADEVSLAPDPDHAADPIQVEVSLRVAAKVSAEGAAEPVPVSMNLSVDYAQQSLGGPDDRFVRRIDRLEGASTPVAKESLLLIAEASDRGAQVTAARGHLSRQELDSLQLTADPLDIDAILPTSPTRDSGTWKTPPEALDRLLRLRADASSEVTGIVTDVTPSHVRIRLAGAVRGVAEGAETELDLRGVGLFDRKLGRMTKLNLAWSESRTIGPATPAVEATVKLNVSLKPLSPKNLIDEQSLVAAAAATFDDRLSVRLKSRDWSLLADRQWFVVANDRYATTLRRVADNRVTAATTLVPASRREMTLDAFQQEVRRSLGDNLVEVYDTSDSGAGSHLRRLSVSSVGNFDGAPVEWRHVHVGTPSGSIAATSTLPSNQGETDAAAAERLVESLTPGPANNDETAATGAAAVRR